MFFQHFKIVIHQPKKGDHFGDSHPYWPFHVQTHPHELRSNSNYVWSLKAWACSTKQNNKEHYHIIYWYIWPEPKNRPKTRKSTKIWANKHSGGPWRSRGCYKRSPTLVLRPSPVPHLCAWSIRHRVTRRCPAARAASSGVLGDTMPAEHGDMVGDLWGYSWFSGDILWDIFHESKSMIPTNYTYRYHVYIYIYICLCVCNIFWYRGT